MFPILAVLIGLLGVATALPFSRCQHYLIRGWDFPRLQIAIGLLVLAGGQIAAGWTERPIEWVVLGIAVVALGVQARWILPYSIFAPKEVAEPRDPRPERSIRLLSANVLQPNRNAAGFLALVRRAAPDIVIVLEGNAWWQERLDVLEGEGYTHTMKCPLENLYGMLVYSRRPLFGMSTQFLVDKECPSMHAIVELLSGERVTLHVLHPAPPSPTENETSEERDAELVMVGKAVHGAKRPAIVAGDLNDVAWSATTRLFRKVSGMLDPRVGRGLFSSYHAKIPGMRWPLDHLFHSRHFCLNEIRRLPGFGSDHFPLLIDLQLAADEKGEGLSADAEEEAWAEELLEDAGADESEVPDAAGDENAKKDR